MRGYSAGIESAPATGPEAGWSAKQVCRVSWFVLSVFLHSLSAQAQAASHFQEEAVTRISRTVLCILQVMRDTLLHYAT